jgi:hypothetical protein
MTLAWWVVDFAESGSGGGHLIEAATGRSALAEFRRLMIMFFRDNGDSARDAAARVRAHRPQVYLGPLTTSEAAEYETGWSWAIAIADRYAVYHTSNPIAAAPVTRVVAMQLLGEAKTTRIEQQVAALYPTQPGDSR